MSELFSIAAVTPWFNNTALVGALLGSGCGVLGGILGVLMGVLAPRGIGKPFVIAFEAVVGFLGVITLIVGITGMVQGQPYGVWYPLAIVGFISATVFGTLLPITKMVYRRAEEQKLEAEEFRANFNQPTG